MARSLLSIRVESDVDTFVVTSLEGRCRDESVGDAVVGVSAQDQPAPPDRLTPKPVPRTRKPAPGNEWSSEWKD